MSPPIDDRRQQRIRLLEAAGQLLREHGISGVSLRRVADAADTSTQMIYTIFGGKDGLFRALWQEGFERLAESLDDITDHPTPGQRLRALGEGYRRFAIANPTLYEAMFARSIAEYRPETADIERDTRAFQILFDCVCDCVDAGQFNGLEPRAVADALWTAVHGAVGLELSGFYDSERQAESQFQLTLSATAAGLNVVGSGELPPSTDEV